MQASKLVSPNGSMWTENGGVWSDDNGASQSWYPGGPAPTGKRSPREPPFHCDEEGQLRIAIQRLARRRGGKGFGNARAVRALFDKVRDNQATRIARERSNGRSPDIYHFSRTELLGPDISERTLQECEEWKKLQAMEGLAPVKASIAQLFQVTLRNLEREKRGEPPFEIALNRLFLGNPGTGKTTVAALYGKILARLGLLSKGEVVLKTASEFVGDVLGASEKTTRNIIESAEGNVLIIDEAYSLYSGGSGPAGSNDPYKTAVVDTIVEQIQAKPGADIAVILIGYPEEMQRMMRKVNPGLSRRFQVEDAFHFPGYDDTSLLKILMAKAKEKVLSLDLDVAKRAVRGLAAARARPNFGNAGSVENLLSRAVLNMNRRPDMNRSLIADDFGYSGDEIDEASLKDHFADLVGCDQVREVMVDLRCTIELSKKLGRSPTENGVSFNYLFLGSPGTGKTTIARRMGRMFHGLGLLPSDEMKEIKASDLVTGYAGQAGQKTREILREIRGGCLFIDEAYQMNPARGGPYMTEAVDELVGVLTDEEFKGKLLVILAGYDHDMEEMLQTNPGLSSRFSERIHFSDFDAKSSEQLLLQALEKQGTPLECEDRRELEKLAARLVASDGFANGRDVDTWSKNVYKQVSKTFGSEALKGSVRPGSLVCNLQHVKNALDKMLQSRTIRRGGPKCSASEPSAQVALQQQLSSAPTPPRPSIGLDVDVETAEEEDVVPMEMDSSPVQEPSAFDDVDMRILKTLQAVLHEEGLNGPEGAKTLATLQRDSPAFVNLVQRLSEETGMALDEATEQLVTWQSAQEKLQGVLQQKRTLGARPLWRCAVCGRADKPWIACYVAPFIVGYQKIEQE